MSLAAIQVATPQPSELLHVLLERVVLRVRRRLAWLRHLDAEAGADPLARLMLDAPDDEARFYGAHEPLQALARRLAAVEAHLADERQASLLHRLVRLFDLDPAENDIVQTALALELAPALGPAFALLAGTPPYVTEELVRRLFDHSPAPLAPPGCALRRWRLLLPLDAAPGDPTPLQLDPQVRSWLAGLAPLHPQLLGLARPVESHEPLRTWPVRETTGILVDHLRAPLPVRLIISGVPGSGRRTFAAAVFHAVGLVGFSVAAQKSADAGSAERALLVVRHALLTGMAPIWELLAEGIIWPDEITVLATFAVVCTPHERPAPIEGVIDLRVELPAPELTERVTLWRELVSTSDTWPEGHLTDLALRYPLPVGELTAIGQQRPASAAAAAELCRERTRHRLGELGHVLRCPFGMNDLVIPARLKTHLAEFIFEARDRLDFWERPEAQRLYPRGTGLVALFTGPAGTGKTMAAQVLAAELGLDLVRIDLASVVSKYIGETAKSLRRIFTAASGMSAVLLFDEADALFARRTDVRDAHDRHANADTNYLLQLVEDFAGIALLASNKKANIDPAFLRRIRHVLDFPRPEPAARRQIWQRILGELAAPLPDPALDLLATIDLSGAQIKNAVLAAVFAARSERRQLSVPHLVRGVERELDKDGRTLDRRERERLMAHG